MKVLKNSKTVFYLFILLLLSACGANESSLSSGDNNASSASGTAEIMYNHYNSTAHHSTEVIHGWAELVEKETEGRIKVNVKDGAVLGSAANHYEDLHGGVYDMILGMPAYFLDTDLYKLSIGNLPFALTDLEKGSQVQTKYTEQYGEGAWGEGMFFAQPQIISDPYLLYSSKPINSIDDLKGMQIRVADEIWEPVLKEWGASPIFIATSEIYSALEKGTIDGAIYSLSGGVSYKLPEVAPYVLETEMSGYVLSPVIAESAIESVPSDLKSLFEEDLLPKFNEMFIEHYTKILPEYRAQLEEDVEANGGEIITWSEEEVQKLRSSAKPAWDQWVEIANENGYQGEEMMEYFKQLMEENGLALPY